MPKAIARVLGLTDRAIRLAPLRADAADILHPLLFTFDTAKQVGQRYFPPGYVPSLEEDAAASLDRFLRRDVMSRFATREAHFALREALILALAGVAAFLFLNHENLYLTGPFTLSKAPLEAYFLVTTVMYLFLRLVVIALGMRVPRARAELVRCPECGQWIDDSTAAGREAHHRIELTPKPSPKAIVSTVALRKAVDAARVAGKASELAPHPELPAGGEPENVPSADLLAALNDPDLLERLLHSLNPPRDPRLKR